MSSTLLRQWITPTVIVTCLGPCGCSSMNKTETGAMVGGAAGAGIGALAGAACHNPGVAAAIGAGAGALTGAVVGHAADQTEEKAKDQAVAALQAQQQQQQLAMGDVVRMVQDHISDAVIIQHIRTSPVVFQLNGRRYRIPERQRRERPGDPGNAGHCQPSCGPGGSGVRGSSGPTAGGLRVPVWLLALTCGRWDRGGLAHWG
jgi:hypothetical protein